MQIAILTWERLPKVSRLQFARLLRSHPRFAEDFEGRMPKAVQGGSSAERDKWLFAHASTWPDIARGQPAYHRPTWHYVNVPLFATDAARLGMEAAVLKRVNTGGDLPASPRESQLNVTQAIGLNRARLGDASISAGERAVALSWLLHLVGDVHQPAHAAAMFTPRGFPKGDRGGNRVEVGTRNLHALWDAALGTGDTMATVRRRVRLLQGQSRFRARCRTAADALAPTLWVEESHGLARSAVYTAPVLKAFQDNEAAARPADQVRVTLDASYREAMAVHAQGRAIAAACRLAALLTDRTAASTEPAGSHSRWGCTALPGAGGAK